MTQCMVRPCVARVFVEIAVRGLASMYPASDWSVALPATMDISARAISLPDRPRIGHLGITSARTRREDRSSISSHPLADLGGLEASGYIIASSLGGCRDFPRLETPATGKNAPRDARQLLG